MVIQWISDMSRRARKSDGREKKKKKKKKKEGCSEKFYIQHMHRSLAIETHFSLDIKKGCT